jgi:hypothetical protein
MAITDGFEADDCRTHSRLRGSGQLRKTKRAAFSGGTYRTFYAAGGNCQSPRSGLPAMREKRNP